MDPTEKDYIVVVQCHLVKQRCSGAQCEQAFHHRDGAFADYPADRPYRTLYLTCGGCCGRALQRKLLNLVHCLDKKDGIGRDRIVVQLSSCIAFESFHGPRCPNLAYLRKLIGRLNLDIREGTKISDTSERRRAEGVYRTRETQ